MVLSRNYRNMVFGVVNLRARIGHLGTVANKGNRVRRGDAGTGETGVAFRAARPVRGSASWLAARPADELALILDRSIERTTHFKWLPGRAELQHLS
jgi:hypothetical protein